MFVVSLSLCCITKSGTIAATSSHSKREVKRNVESNRVGTSPTSDNAHMRFQSWFKLADICTVLTNARASLISNRSWSCWSGLVYNSESRRSNALTMFEALSENIRAIWTGLIPKESCTDDYFSIIRSAVCGWWNSSIVIVLWVTHCLSKLCLPIKGTFITFTAPTIDADSANRDTGSLVVRGTVVSSRLIWDSIKFACFVMLL